MPADRQSITATRAPEAVGPYVHAVRTGKLLFCSGQIGLDPKTGELIGDGLADQVGRCLENLAAICDAAGTTLGNAVKLTLYITEMTAFAEANDVYGLFFEADPPARVAVGVTSLPRGAKVMIDAVIALP